MNNPLSMILDWLRVGYPDGVPPKDFYPLLALLTHNLSEEELEKIVGELQRENPEGDVTPEEVRGAIGRVTAAPVTEDHEREVAERLADAGWPLDEESAEVARAVAADGGVHDGAEEAAQDAHQQSSAQPSASPAPADQGASSTPAASDAPAASDQDLSTAPSQEDARASSNSVQRIIDWLSAGYPAGIPATDRIPLLALLRRQLTDDEAQEIASHLVDEAGRRIVDPTDAGVAITRYTNDLPTEQEMRRVAEHLAVKGWPLGERS